MLKNLSALLVPAALILGGCLAESDAPTGSVDQDMTGDNGVSINGVSINGVSINGVSINGVSINGVSINGVSINGNALSAQTTSGQVLTGTGFVGAVLSATLSDGTPIALRVDSATTLTGANSDVWAYSVTVQTDQGWARLCGDETDGSAKQAIPVEGTWNTVTGAWSASGGFSFACRKASVAKCVEFGYKPWEGLADEHHACVRMLRADYCGDGVPHTINGTQINIYDHADIQSDTESWDVDAEWGPDGALCFKRYRGGSQPSCYAQKYSATCGNFSSGALLIDEYNGNIPGQ